MLHDCLLDHELASTENFFQAAKCLTEADARYSPPLASRALQQYLNIVLRFYFELNGGNAARYGQGRLHLTNKQKARLQELGVDSSEFVSAGAGKWKR